MERRRGLLCAESVQCRLLSSRLCGQQPARNDFDTTTAPSVTSPPPLFLRLLLQQVLPIRLRRYTRQRYSLCLPLCLYSLCLLVPFLSLSLSLSVCLSVSIFVCLSACLSVCLSLSLSLCLCLPACLCVSFTSPRPFSLSPFPSLCVNFLSLSP